MFASIPYWAGAVVEAMEHRSPDKLLHGADLAMFEAKRSRCGFTVLTDSMRDTAAEVLQLRTNLCSALSCNGFLQQPELAGSIVGGLRELGVRVALDG